MGGALLTKESETYFDVNQSLSTKTTGLHGSSHCYSNIWFQIESIYSGN